MITREEFQGIVHEIAGKKDKRDRETLQVRWMTGGAWGGNCWGDRDPSSYQPDPQPEPEFEELDDILLRVVPNLSFLQYKKILKLIRYDTKMEHEYYGNYTTYGMKEIQIQDIWRALKDMNVV